MEAVGATARAAAARARGWAAGAVRGAEAWAHAEAAEAGRASYPGAAELRAAGRATRAALAAWWALVGPYAVVGAKLGVRAALKGGRGCRAAWGALDAEQRGWAVLVAAGAAALLLLRRFLLRSAWARARYQAAAALERRVAGRWRALVGKVRQTSQLGALALPHVLFLAAAVLVHFGAPAGSGPGAVLRRPALWHALARAVPVGGALGAAARWRAYDAARAQEEAASAALKGQPSPAGSILSPVHWLRRRSTPKENGATQERPAERKRSAEFDRHFGRVAFWLQAFSFIAVWMACRELPLVGRMAKKALGEGVAGTAQIAVLAWSLLPATSGCVALAPTIGNGLGLGTFLPLGQGHLERASSQARGLAAALGQVGLVPEAASQAMAAVVNVGPQLLAVPFLLAPGVLCSYGVLLAKYVLPARQSLAAISAGDGRLAESWTKYWVVLSLSNELYALALRVLWIPFKVHLELLLVLYLSIPAFKGTDRVFAPVLAHWMRLSSGADSGRKAGATTAPPAQRLEQGEGGRGEGHQTPPQSRQKKKDD